MTAGASEPQAGVGRGVIGVLRRGEELLLVRRAAHLRAGGNWCFPGGHVEPGERPEDAVVRELAEELAITVAPVARAGEVTVASPAYVLDVWLVRLVAGTITPEPSEVSDWRWVAPADVPSLAPGMASNAGVLALLGLR